MLKKVTFDEAGKGIFLNFSETFFSSRGEIAKELLFSKITFSAVLSLLTRGKKVRTKKNIVTSANYDSTNNCEWDF